MSDDNTNTTESGAPDPKALSLDELRALRTELQQQDDVVSYARRVAQARVDLVKSEMARRDDTGTVSDEVTEVLSQHLTGGPGRPPRPAEDLSDNTLSAELDSICSKLGFGRIEDLTEDELATLAEGIEEFERRVSQDRRQRFDLLDALSAELVRRYRDGEADVDSLLNN
ncbi:RsiG family protein [Ilumatobacter coccineus]|jgi:RsiG-like|uniref:RsiG-like domain-containing protein n=1 Tax=Ilumatobacter coccineus (strain NBRC 103263 / KCTC 29153 / YM16-304) TaxID=1313172 RepID=A0A6C7EGJ6_ILUCY|nr:hypothetical protein [Ilumatobacter coccineus]BAN04105.1 hypothetical protein YM304_37910 [Ilumatobacter coccineus YM16-304]